MLSYVFQFKSSWCVWKKDHKYLEILKNIGKLLMVENYVRKLTYQRVSEVLEGMFPAYRFNFWHQVILLTTR